MNPAENYILSQPEPFKTMLLEVQVLIEHTLPDFNLLFKWKIPFYFSGKCPICYLNVSKGYLDVCFWLSDDFALQIPELVSEKRKRVKSLRYYKLEDIKSNILINCIKEAYRTRDEGFKVR